MSDTRCARKNIRTNHLQNNRAGKNRSSCRETHHENQVPQVPRCCGPFCCRTHRIRPDSDRRRQQWQFRRRRRFGSAHDCEERPSEGCHGPEQRRRIQGLRGRSAQHHARELSRARERDPKLAPRWRKPGHQAGEHPRNLVHQRSDRRQRRFRSADALPCATDDHQWRELQAPQLQLDGWLKRCGWRPQLQLGLQRFEPRWNAYRH